MHINATDAVAAKGELIAHGYTRQFRIRDGTLYDLRSKETVDPAQVTVEARFRFETEPWAGDATNIYALDIGEGTSKGFLVDAFDLQGEGAPRTLLDHLGGAAAQTRTEHTEVENFRYGVRKVRKAEFDADPLRYVLRLDFPDFPPCPFGQGFAMLGFDTALQEYVWLATNILRDERLRRVRYRE